MGRIPPNHVNPRNEPRHVGKIRIGRSTATGGEDCMTIHITDENTGIALLDLEMDMKDFAYALSGLSNMPITYRLRGAEYVGMLQEYKEIQEPVYLEAYDDRAQAAWDHAQPYCVDGWMYAGPRRDAGRGASWSQSDWTWYTNPMGAGPGLSNHIVRLKFIRFVPSIAAAEKPVIPQPQPSTRTRVRVRRPEQE